MRTPAFKDVDRRDRRAAGGQYWVKHQAKIDLGLGRQLVVVGHRLERRMIAIQPKMPYMRGWNQIDNRIDHTKPSAQDRHQPDLHADLLAD